MDCFIHWDRAPVGTARTCANEPKSTTFNDTRIAGEGSNTPLQTFPHQISVDPEDLHRIKKISRV